MATEHCTLYAAVSADRTVSPVSVLRPANQIVSQTRRFLSQNEKRRRNKSVFIFEIVLLCFKSNHTDEKYMYNLSVLLKTVHLN